MQQITPVKGIRGSGIGYLQKILTEGYRESPKGPREAEENTFQIAGITCGRYSAFKTSVSAPHFVDLILRVPAWELRGRNPIIGPFPDWGEGGRLLGGV